MPPDSVDVAIIGAGLAGLTAAKDLLAGRKTIVILEARSRVGGKILNATLKNGDIAEVGAEFVGPTQDRVLALISELGLKTFDVYNEGNHILHRNGNTKLYIPSKWTQGAPPVSILSLIQTGIAQVRLDSWAAQIDVSAPWAHPKAKEWDSTTFAQWLKTWGFLGDSKFLFDVFSKSIFGAETHELSLLYVLTYIAAAGNEKCKGDVNRLISTKGGAQESRVEGGTGAITEQLAERIGKENIMLDAAVSSITKESDGSYSIVSKAGTVKAKKVVMALAPPLMQNITFSPPLPEARQKLNELMKMGAYGKGIAIYDTPFWRIDLNSNAQLASNQGHVRLTYDNSPDNASFGALLGFTVGDDMRDLDTKSEAEAQEIIVSDLTRYFGEKAENVKEFMLQRWDLEEFSKGGPVAFSGPNVLQQYGHALREVVDGIHFAGTETAEHWVGYMDGAVRSGERAAKEILGS